jgi:hypothetical protein
MNIGDSFQSITNDINQYVLLAALFLVTLATVIVLNRGAIRQSWLNIKTHFCLNRLGLKRFSNFSCPDGLGDHFVIDRLLMCPDSISVIVFKQYPGIIFCSDNIDEWSQVLDGKSYKFKNPLIDLEYQVNAVSACIPGVPVNGYLFFDHQALFPKGHPERVIQLDSIPQSLKRDKHVSAEASVESAWEKLRSLIK